MIFGYLAFGTFVGLVVVALSFMFGVTTSSLLLFIFLMTAVVAIMTLALCVLSGQSKVKS